jgi:hypothetical protein
LALKEYRKGELIPLIKCFKLKPWICPGQSREQEQVGRKRTYEYRIIVRNHFIEEFPHCISLLDKPKLNLIMF